MEDLNDLIDEIDIEKTLNKRKVPTTFNEKENQNQETQQIANDSTSESATKTRAGARKSRLNKTLQTGQNNHD